MTARDRVFNGGPIDELLDKDRQMINETSIRRWFMTPMPETAPHRGTGKKIPAG